MLRLISLKFGNIRSFVGDQYISFYDKNKIIKIDGKNENTGGSSGAGKSSIIAALDYLLGINDLPLTVLQSRLTKDGVWVEAEFDVDGKKAIISRSKKNGLSIDIDGQIISGNLKIAEEKLDELIGIPRQIFKKMIHKKQKEGGFFLNMSPNEIYHFLIGMTGLSKYIKYEETIGNTISKYKKDIDSIEASLPIYKNAISDFQNMLKSKQEPVCNINKEHLKNMEDQIVLLNSKIKKQKEELKIKVDSIEKPTLKEVFLDDLNDKILSIAKDLKNQRALLQELDKKNTEYSIIIKEQPLLLNKVKKINESIVILNQEQEHILNGKCPTCSQIWASGDSEEGLFKIKNKINDLKSEISEIVKKLKYIQTLPPIIDQNNQDKTGIETQIKLLEQQKQEQELVKIERIKKASAIDSANQDDYYRQIKEIENDIKNALEQDVLLLNTLQNDFKLQQNELNNYSKSLAIFKQEVAQINQTIHDKILIFEKENIKLVELSKKLKIAEETKKVLKNYITRTFQETLSAIGEKATNILSSIPNMSSATVFLEGCKETKSGTIKDDVTATINIEGEDDVPIKSLSGGERTAIDLAIDLSVIDVIENISGKGADFIFLDEPFDGLDSVCKQNCMDILSQMDLNKRILIIDHSPELKEMISETILITKKGEFSSVG